MRQPATHQATRIVQEEHDRLSAVIQGMLHYVRAIKNGAKTPDLKVFRAMLFYICEYPEKVHHPKEDNYFFALLRKRTDVVNDTLAELESQHAGGDALVRELEHALTRYELQGDVAFPAFNELAERYGKFYFHHMRLEEDQIIPAADKFLTAEDWQVVDAAFATNQDPLAGTTEREAFDKLFALIVNITPAPIGLGPAA